MGFVPPRFIPPSQLLDRPGNPELDIIISKFGRDLNKLPLRKCLQCKQLKREKLQSQKCQMCYEQNELEEYLEIETGEPIPLDRNLIYQPFSTTIPDPPDYLWYFFKWLFRKQEPQLK